MKISSDSKNSSQVNEIGIIDKINKFPLFVQLTISFNNSRNNKLSLNFSSDVEFN